ncbi:MAG: TolC family protein [Terriglobia bacterium]
MADVLKGVALAAVLCGFGLRARAQNTPAAAATMSYQSPVSASSGGSASNPVAAISAPQNPFFGSVPVGKPTSGVLPLSLRDAMERGLRYNLGLLLDEQSTQAERGARWQALSKLLPHVTTGTTETRQQINLQALGFPGGFPGVPIIVGPFSTFDARVFLTTPVVNLQYWRGERAASESVRAAEYSERDARNLVVLVVGNAYLMVNASAARIQSVAAEERTAQALYRQAVDRFHAGLSPEIDMLRAQVELKLRQEQLLAAHNDYSTEKLGLARAIGLPLGQRFALTTKTPYAPLPAVNLDKALADAYRNRPDYQSALAQVRAAEAQRRAVAAERLPSVSLDANFGDIGLTPGNSHETFLLSGTLHIPVFQGGKVHADVLQADAQLRQKQDQLANLKAQIDYDVRTALMNLQTASDQVQVARSNIALANRTLTQAQDRFTAGVTDNIEVVQAQEAVASANEVYISSLYQHNLAKVALARAVGIAEQAVLQYLGEK